MAAERLFSPLPKGFRMEATTQPQNQPARFRNDDDLINYVPVHVVWEITLACNQKCQHCGSRAGKARSDELSTAECLSVVEQLAEMGTREITLIGGEAYLRKDWLEIVRAIRSHGIYCAIQTGGWNLDAKRYPTPRPPACKASASPSTGWKRCTIERAACRLLRQRLRNFAPGP